jgi:hypothetical protein
LSPEAGVMNPKPFSLLKNFTVPVAIFSISFFSCCTDSYFEGLPDASFS